MKKNRASKNLRFNYNLSSTMTGVLLALQNVLSRSSDAPYFNRVFLVIMQICILLDVFNHTDYP
ncbi:hypothetical protein K0B03_04485 [Patescibacteria group bacterium]|nr:hypothetical protein [Patescibacteria group bacterium]